MDTLHLALRRAPFACLPNPGQSHPPPVSLRSHQRCKRRAHRTAAFASHAPSRNPAALPHGIQPPFRSRRLRPRRVLQRRPQAPRHAPYVHCPPLPCPLVPCPLIQIPRPLPLPPLPISTTDASLSAPHRSTHTAPSSRRRPLCAQARGSMSCTSASASLRATLSKGTLRVASPCLRRPPEPDSLPVARSPLWLAARICVLTVAPVGTPRCARQQDKSRRQEAAGHPQPATCQTNGRERRQVFCSPVQDRSCHETGRGIGVSSLTRIPRKRGHACAPFCKAHPVILVANSDGCHELCPISTSPAVGIVARHIAHTWKPGTTQVP